MPRTSDRGASRGDLLSHMASSIIPLEEQLIALESMAQTEPTSRTYFKILKAEVDIYTRMNISTKRQSWLANLHLSFI
jgi:hypothetical protein